MGVEEFRLRLNTASTEENWGGRSGLATVTIPMEAIRQSDCEKAEDMDF